MALSDIPITIGMMQTVQPQPIRGFGSGGAHQHLVVNQWHSKRLANVQREPQGW